MKSVFMLIGFMALVCVAGVFFLGHQGSKDAGHQLAMAFTKSKTGGMQVLCGVGPRIPMRDPRLKETGELITWSQWVKDHFELRDSDGTLVPLKRMGTSRIFLMSKAAGAPDFVLYAEVTTEADYTFDYIPVAGEQDVYRAEITVPTEPTDVTRKLFAKYIEEDA